VPKKKKAEQTAETVVPAEIAKEKLILESEAEAKQILNKANAEADGIFARLNKTADGFKAIVGAAGGNTRDASTLMVVNQLETLVPLQVEAVKNLKIEKVVVWDGGKNGDGKHATAEWMSGMIKSLPALHDLLKATGIELPEYLGSMVDPDGGNGGSPDAQKETVVELPPETKTEEAGLQA